MSDFSKLLRSSRVAQVARPLKRANARHQTHPTRQLLETREAALARQEWGIKYALPSKIRSRYITLTELDSLERLVDFEANGGDHYRRLRFQELGLVPRTESEKNPLFHKPSRTPTTSSKQQVDDAISLSPSLSQKRVQAVLDQLSAMRPELKQHLLSRVPMELQDAYKSNSTSIGDKFESLAFEFLLERVQTGNKNHTDSVKRLGHKIEGTGGLSYSLRGRLRNSPNGLVNREIVPGRILSEEATAVGGFVASSNIRASMGRSLSSNSQSRETPTPQFPIGAFINTDGSVKLTVEPPRTDVDRNSYATHSSNRVQSRSSNRSRPEIKKMSSTFYDLLDYVQKK